MSTTEVDPIRVVLVVADALERLGVPHFVGGSLAGAVHGAVRATADADIVADLRPGEVDGFVDAIEPWFYVDGEAVRHAVDARRSFNVLHRSSTFKVDVFVTRGTAFDASQMARRIRETVAEGPSGMLYFASAEDTILAKLVWYRSGGEVSERQWSDVLAVIRTTGDGLDRPYILHWADTLDVFDLWHDAETASRT